MKKKFNQYLSLLLSLSLTLSLCAPTVRAAEESFLPGDPEQSVCLDGTAEDSTCEANTPDNAAQEEPVSAEEAFPSGEDIPSDVDADFVPQDDFKPQSSDDSHQQALSAETPEPDTDPEPREAERIRVRSADQLSDFLTEHWTGDYFQEAVVDTKRNRVTVDGERVSVTDAFGPDADRTAIFDSPEAAEAYFEDTAFETESSGGGTLIVTAPWQTCRIVVTARSLDGDYGAETVVEYPKYHQFVLQFSDEESTRLAYEELSEKYPCYVDEVLRDDDLLQDAGDSTWGYEYMGFSSPKSSGAFSDAAPIQVAVIDSGCWADNPFFEGRSFSGASRSFGDDQGAFIDVDGGYHGTHVAGILHTCTPANVELMILRIWDTNGKTSLLVADTALKYALENGAEVINFSAGKQGINASEDFALDQSLNIARDMGVPVVCSAGNVSRDVNTNYPACNPDTIAVSAINRSGQFAYTYSETPDTGNLGTGGSGSSYGAGVDFCAPGVKVVSASKTGTTSKDGTSMAAPHVAAALAWLRLEDPSASWDTLYARLRGLCVDLGTAGKDRFYGWGCPNLSTLTGTASGHVHHWTGSPTEPTCNSRGYTVYTCSGCSLVRMKDYRGPVHSFNQSGVCTICGKRMTTRCGENAAWTYSSATETLTITGSGTVSTASWENLYPQQFIRRVSLSGVTEVTDGLFSGYLSLESVQMDTSIETLGKKCFYGCTALKSVLLPRSLTTIGDGALCGCTALERIDCRSSSFTVEDDCLLYSSDMTRLIACGGTWGGGTMTVPDTVCQIGAFACEGVSAITELRLSPALKELGEGAFRNCSNLEKIYARSSVTTVGDKAFGGERARVYVSEGCTGWENHAAIGSKLTWDSYPGDLSRWTMSLNSTRWPYTGAARRPGIILTHGDTTLWNYADERGGHSTNHEDYFEHSYSNNTELGLDTDGESAPTATITGVGIYYGSQSLPFTIALAAPKVNAPVHTEQGITVSWESVFGADWYKVLRRDVSEEGEWTFLPGAVTAENSWTDTTMLSGHTYTYSVVCYTDAYNTADKSVRNRYKSRYESEQPSILFVGTSQLSSAELVDGDSVSLHWDAVGGAASYRVLRLDKDEEWVTLAEGVTGTQWTDSSPVPGKSNVYAVQAVAGNGTESVLSALLSVDCPAVPVLLIAANEGTGVRVKWQKYEGAAKYRVLCKTGSSGWKTVADTSSTTALVKTYDGKNTLKTGKTYTFTVRCLTADGKSCTTGCDPKGKSVVYVCAPAISSVKNVKKQKLTAAWKRVSGVTGYQVQVALNSRFTSGKKTANLKGADNVKRTFTGLKKKATCYVRVRSYKTVSGKSYWSTWSGVKKVTIKK